MRSAVICHLAFVFFFSFGCSKKRDVVGGPAAPIVHSVTPIQPYGMGSGVTSVSAGNNSTCAVQNGTPYCWGSGYMGQLGSGTVASPQVPKDVSALLAGTVKFANRFSGINCAIDGSGGLKCFGNNVQGVVGNGEARYHSEAEFNSLCGDHCEYDGTPYFVLNPVQVLGLDGIGVADVATEANHACALTQAGAVYCWGINSQGELGMGDLTWRQSAIAPSLASGVSALAVGGESTCVLSSGAVQCWGVNNGGMLGLPASTGRAESPTPVPGLESGVTKISLNGTFGLAVKDAALYVWGNTVALEYKIIEGAASLQHVPPTVKPELANDIVDAVTGDLFGCALKTDGTVWCFGFNDAGQLGVEDAGSTCTITDVYNCGGTPRQIALPAVATKIAAGGKHACAIVSDTGLWCWGSDEEYQLGNPRQVAH